MPTVKIEGIEMPEEISHVLWKMEQGFSSVSTEHIKPIVKWARSVAEENAQLRADIAELRKQLG